jgi:Fe-S-cluster containining protein
MANVIPPLRDDLIIEQDEATGAGAVHDKALGQRIKLDARGIAVLRSLDRQQSLTDLAERLDSSEENLGRVIDVLQRRHLLQDDDTRLHVEESTSLTEVLAAPSSEVPLLIRPEAAFSCTMCGSCCGGHNIGPVLPDTRAGIEAHRDELLTATGSEGDLFVTVPSGPQGEQVLCHSRDGSCVFLTEERRCLLHQRYGASSKPRICRLFPYNLVATPKGVAVSISQECRGYAEARHGQKLTEQVDEIRDMLEFAPRIERTRPVLRLSAEQALTYRRYQDIETALHDALDEANDPTAALLAMRAVLLDHGAETEPGPRPPIEAIAAFIDGLCDAIAERCEALADAHQLDSETAVVRVESARLMALAASRLRPDLARVAAPLDRPEHHALFVASMHERLAAKELAEAPTLVSGFSRLVLNWLLARTLMVARARQVKRRHLVEQDIVDATVTISFLMRNEAMRAALDELDSPTVQLCFDWLPELLGNAAELGRGPERVELFRF